MSQPKFSLSNTPEIIELDYLRGSESTSHIFDHNLSNRKGNGIIRFIKLDLGFRVVEIDVKLKTSIQLNLYNCNKNFIYFIYCTEGHVYHKFDDQIKFSSIEELCLSIVGSNYKADSSLLLNYNRPVRLSMVCIDKSIFFKEYITELPLEDRVVCKTSEILKSLNKLDDYVYNCAQNLRFTEKIRYINPLEVNDELLDLLKIKSSYLGVLSLYLEEFYKELYIERSLSRLNTYELQQIRKSSEFILDSLDYQHCIKSLCSYSGLSPAKLQEGFKSMHGKTVSDFIRNKRLDKAEQLFMNTDYNVSEVVYMIGITSRSYFCKIFKTKFGVSPSNFRKNKLNREEYLMAKK